MKLNNMNAAALINRFEHECRSLYLQLREKHVFTRDYLIVNNIGMTNELIDTAMLKENAASFDGDKFECISEFYIDNLTIHITYGGEYFNINMNLSVDWEDEKYYFTFEDLFNFCAISELRKTDFIYISNEDTIGKIMERYGDFLALYLSLVLDLLYDETRIQAFINYCNNKFKGISIKEIWFISKGDRMFEKGDYTRAIKAYSKVLPLLSFVQKAYLRE